MVPMLRKGTGLRSATKFAALALAVGGCGGSDGDSDGPPPVNTLAYVVTKCSEGAQGLLSSYQALLIRQPARPPVPVMELGYPLDLLPAGLGLCRLFGQNREGAGATFVAAFQRLGILNDGSGVVFEVTDDFASFAPNQLIPHELESSVEGFFF